MKGTEQAGLPARGRYGVVADDITGANDIGIMFAKAGMVTHVYAYEPHSADYEAQQHAEVLILDTNSRFDEGETAYRKVYEATRQLQGLGCTRFINKTCSVFRGNIGREFDAMLDALQAEFAVVVLGFPKNGRLTIDGVHYVHGNKLEESEFRSDPVHPMTRSDLQGILQAQTERKVALITRETVEQGPDAIKIRLNELRGGNHYAILDVTSQAALAVIAQAVQDEPILCGSSALAEELALLEKSSGQAALDSGLKQHSGLGVLCTAGSLMPQTAAQIKCLKDTGITSFELDTLRLLNEKTRGDMISRLIEEISELLVQGRDALLHSANDPEQVKQTKEAGVRAGLSNTDVSRLVSSTIAEITASVMERTGQNRLVVAGGDTSASVCERLGVGGMRVWKEIQPGLPSCISISEQPVLMVLKSGSFGKDDFLVQAMEHVKAQ